MGVDSMTFFIVGFGNYFHMIFLQYETFPGNLSITDEDLEKIGQNDINAL